MQISSRFTVALHIFACVDAFQDTRKVTSELLAGSIDTNPVIVRKILAMLKKAGLVNVARGAGGVTLARRPEEVTFLDVYRAIEPLEGGDLFRFHEHPCPACPVGRNIHALLDERLRAIQNAMEDEMRKYTLAQLHEGLTALLAEEERRQTT
jgi:Rrf2 family protein